MMLLSAIPFSGGEWLDVIFLGFCAVALVFGAFSGVSGELSRILGVVTGFSLVFVLLRLFQTQVIPADMRFHSLLSFVAALAVAAFVGLCVQKLVKKFLTLLIVQPLDGILGALLRILMVSLIFCLLLALLRLIPWQSLQSFVFEESFCGKMFRPVVEMLFDMAATNVQ